MPTTPAWLIDLPQCDSTNTWALAHLDALAHGACIHTTCQTAGRGQPGNAWHAPPGVLTASLVLDTGQAPVALIAGLAVAHAVEDLVPGIQVQIKWPNDCLIAGRKLAGILCERTAARTTRVVVGIGLNLDPHWDQCPGALHLASDARWPPTSLAEHGAAPTAIDALIRLRHYLLEAAGLMTSGHWCNLLPEIRKRDALQGHRLHLEGTGGSTQGTGAGIDDQGRLLVLVGDDTQVITSARRVTILPE